MILFDTNIFIDMLAGCHQASIELNSYDEPAISAITYMELRAGEIPRPQDKPVLDAVFGTFTLLPIDWEIIEQSIAIRGKSLINPPKIKLPDAIIGATAVRWKLALVTRNPIDFTSLAIPVHIPYGYDSKTGVVSNVQRAYGSPAGPLFTLLK